MSEKRFINKKNVPQKNPKIAIYSEKNLIPKIHSLKMKMMEKMTVWKKIMAVLKMMTILKRKLMILNMNMVILDRNKICKLVI